jgi:manganese/zinc/iron transport system ATP- binding protein
MTQQVDNLIVEVHDLTVSYYKKPVLWDIDLRLPQGNVIGIMGPNGAGKSTLLKTMMGLVPPDSGSIKLFGKALNEVRKQVSYVPQKESIDWDFPASVLDVVVMGRYAQLGLFQRPRKADKEAALRCLCKVGMEALAKRQIAQLSGGQQQRVFLARALAQEAQLYLMDEPFVGVDAATEKMIIHLLQSMAREGKTIVVVHHDLQSAPNYFDWSVLLNTRVVAAGPTQDVLTPALLQETYGGKLTVLSKIGELLREHALPIREPK